MNTHNAAAGRRLGRTEMKQIRGGNNPDIICFRCLFNGPGSGQMCLSTSLSNGPDMHSLCAQLFGSGASAMVVTCTNECDLPPEG